MPSTHGAAPDRTTLSRLLREARTIAVVGLSPNPARPSHEVASYLQDAGYRIVPVRPAVESVLGERAYPDLESAAQAVGAIDVVNVFRRSEFVAALAEPLLAIRPSLVWLQMGIRDPETARRLVDAGIPVVMDRCLMAELTSLVDD
ncbi:MAG TPA: CoA-binding protein [Gemmatimonadales bacterium]|nr:CoA-binding protein [Gemmatimonadales bacterium]